MTALKSVAGFAAAALSALYPVVVYLGFRYQQQRLIGFFLLLIVTLKFFADRLRGERNLFLLMGGTVFAVLLLLTANEKLARFYPVFVSLGLLSLFGFSLWRGPAFITRLAAATGAQLDAQAIAYTRRVTVVWCVFFSLNALVAAYTAIASSAAVWTLYNGLVSYLLAGSLLLIEMWVRPKPKVRR